MSVKHTKMYQILVSPEFDLNVEENWKNILDQFS